MQTQLAEARTLPDAGRSGEGSYSGLHGTIAHLEDQLEIWILRRYRALNGALPPRRRCV